MSKSIMQNNRVCYLTGRTDNLHRHHIYGGSRRASSEEWGCWVYLTGEKHNLSRDSVHGNPALSLQLKEECQRRFEELHGHDAFMAVFGKNYLDEPVEPVVYVNTFRVLEDAPELPF